MFRRHTVLACVATLVGLTGLLHAKAGARAAVVAQVSVHGATVTAVGVPIAVTHGVVLVSVTLADGQITDVTALQLPHDNATSWRFSNHAAAILRSEVLSFQSAAVDTVTGATFTSKAYLTSLQAALDAAR